MSSNPRHVPATETTTQIQKHPPSLTSVWKPIQTLGTVASLLLSPLSFGPTTPRKHQQLSIFANLAPELIREHRVKLYDSSVNTRRGPSSAPSSSSTSTSLSQTSHSSTPKKPRRPASGEPQSSSSPLHHTNDISHSHSHFSSTDTLTGDLDEPPESAHASSELSLFTSFKATLACATTRPEDDDAEEKLHKKKSGRRRGKLADLLFCPTGAGTPLKEKYKAAAAASRVPSPELEAELCQRRRSLLKANERIAAKRNQTDRDLRDVDSLISELVAKRESLSSKLAALEDQQESLAESLEQVEFKLSCIQVDEPFHSEHTILSAFEHYNELVESPGKCLNTLHGHENVVTSVDFDSADGYLVSGSMDWTVRVWDLTSGKPLVTLDGHNGPVRCLQLADQQIVSGSNDGTTRVWDLSRLRSTSSKSLLSLTAGKGTTPSDAAQARSASRSGSISPSCSSSCSENSSSTLHSSEPAEDSESTTITEPEFVSEVPCLSVLTGHEGAITCLYREDDTLVTGSADKTMRQWDLTTGQCVVQLDVLWNMSPEYAAPAPTRPVPSRFGACESSTTTTTTTGDENGTGGFVGAVQFWGHALASGTVDGAIRMWDLRTGQSHRTLKGHVGGVTSLEFDATHVVSGGLDHTVRIWDLRTGGTIEVLHYDQAVSSVSLDCDRIVAAAGGDAVHIYSRARFHQEELHAIGGGAGHRGIQSVRYRGKRIVSGSRDGVVRVWGL